MTSAHTAIARVRDFYDRRAAETPEDRRWAVTALGVRVLAWLETRPDAFWAAHAEDIPADLTVLAARADKSAHAILWSLTHSAKGAARGPAPLPVSGRAGEMIEEARGSLARLRRFDERRVEAVLAVYNAIADAWARKTGRTREQWYETRIASFHVGGSHVDTRLPFDRGSRIKGTTAFLESGLAIVYAFEHADVSTLCHEAGHLLRRDLDGADLRRVELWLGVEGGHWMGDDWVPGRWTADAEERFARAFERYIRDGTTPSDELAEPFETLRLWLRRIYVQIEGSEIDVPISGAGRRVFDRLLGPAERVDTVTSETRASEDEALTPETGRERRAAGPRLRQCPACWEPEGECRCRRTAASLAF